MNCNERVEAEWSRLAQPDKADILRESLAAMGNRGRDVRPYGDGQTAEVIVNRRGRINGS
ncbi:MAG: UDP-N-acetyl glucosamine 2-epimerase [Desulfobacteraceae bacterium]|nr:UDP-N-acetyl glucosamine 2-epimerase [Desulfobacteraceae bacterium]